VSKGSIQKGETDNDERKDDPWGELRWLPRRTEGRVGAVRAGAARCPEASEGQAVPAAVPELCGPGNVLNVLPPDKGTPFLHKHQENDEVYVVVGGRGQGCEGGKHPGLRRVRCEGYRRQVGGTGGKHLHEIAGGSTEGEVASGQLRRFMQWRQWSQFNDRGEAPRRQSDERISFPGGPRSFGD
jgi:hypothetical protein